MTRRHAPLAYALLLSACASVPPTPVAAPVETSTQATQRRAEAPRPAYNLAGYPPAVRDGYIDGCETAKGSTYGRDKRAAGDAQYKMGWNDGFSICSRK